MGNSKKSPRRSRQGQSVKPFSRLDYTTIKGNSAVCQRLRILAWLLTRGPLSTFDARKYLDVMHPAMRILELRESGFNIATFWSTEESQTGKLHRVARYILLTDERAKA